MVAASSPPETVHDVVLLTHQGMSRRAIARALKVSRNTVREVLAAHGVKRTKSHSVLEKKPASKRPSKLDEHRGKIDGLLKLFPDITAQRVFEELKAAGFAGGYTGVKTLVRAVRPRPAATPSLETTVYGPGEMAENDWSPYRIAFTHAPHRILQGFSYALVNSHRKRYSFHDLADLHALMDGAREGLHRPRRAGGPLQIRQPEARGAAVGGQPAHLQPALHRLRHLLRVLPRGRSARPSE